MLDDAALILICTGEKYQKFLQKSIEGGRRFFTENILLFTDCPIECDVAKQVQIEHKGWPDVSLMRYHTFLSQKEWLSQFKYILYVDADMKFCKSVGYEIFHNGITVAIHSGFVNWHGYPELNPYSTAYLPENKVKTYVSGAVQGGSTDEFLKMSEILSHNIDVDLANNYRAKWYDESHLNRYVADHPDIVKILPSEYHLYEQSNSVICRINKGWQLPESRDCEKYKFEPEVNDMMSRFKI
jgi:hypothetical protein